LIFIKYISDAFEEKRGQLNLELSDSNSEWYMKESQDGINYEILNTLTIFCSTLSLAVYFSIDNPRPMCFM